MTRENYDLIKSTVSENKDLPIEEIYDLLPEKLKEPTLVMKFDKLGFEIVTIGNYPIDVYWERYKNTTIYIKSNYKIRKDK